MLVVGVQKQDDLSRRPVRGLPTREVKRRAGRKPSNRCRAARQRQGSTSFLMPQVARLRAWMNPTQPRTASPRQARHRLASVTRTSGALWRRPSSRPNALRCAAVRRLSTNG